MKRRNVSEKSTLKSTSSGETKKIWKDEERIVRDIKLEKLRDNIKILHSQTLERIDIQLSSFMDSVVGELEKYETAGENTLFNGKAEPENQTKKDQEKRFIHRESPLTELMEVKHIRSLYHMFVAALIVSLCSGALGDAFTGGLQAVRIGIRHIPGSFGHFDRALILWLFLFIASCSIHPFLLIWSKTQTLLSSKPLTWIFNRISLILLLLYIFFIGSIVVKFMDNMAPASSAFLLLEQTRFFMKVHAYVRSNSDRQLGKFRDYLYFLFAPTLVYRDSYPRTAQIRWRFIWGCFVEFWGAVLMLSCIVELHIIPEYSTFGLEKQTMSSLVALLSRTILPASLFMLSGFYLMLHAWLNGWAELLQFADRRFYGPWWNSTSYGEFYRTWNTVVHDYLHTYVYKDVRIQTGCSVAAKLAVFAVSAIVHEYILALILGFCYPVMFAQFFGVGTVLAFIRGAAGNGRIANIMLFVSLSWGVGIQISLYSMEAFARINCPVNNSGFVDYFVPRSWTCNGLNL